MRNFALTALAALALAACSPPAEKAAAPSATEPAAQQGQIQAPAGEYKLDPNHSSLVFKVTHMGLSNYTVRFTRFDATLTLDPANPTASSINLTVDPASVSPPDSPSAADYRASHAQRPYRTWAEDLGRSPEFLNAAQFPQATFLSTRVEPTGANTARVTGDLTLRGQTHPVTLDVAMVGSTAQRPFIGGGGIGFSAKGTFNRSQFGLTHLLDPPIVGDAVTIEFEGEFAPAQPPAPEGAKAKN